MSFPSSPALDPYNREKAHRARIADLEFIAGLFRLAIDTRELPAKNSATHQNIITLLESKK